jgi:hypothetical protein
VAHEIVAVFVVRLHDHFGVAVRIELASAREQFLAQLDVIEHFAVVGDPDGLIGVVNGLRATAQVDDRQARMAERDAGLDVEAGSVGPAMRDRANHARELRAIRHPRRVAEP